jgi:hypothetical protein
MVILLRWMGDSITLAYIHTYIHTYCHCKAAVLQANNKVGNVAADARSTILVVN